jgi:ATP-dependent Clp protease ATP-binding subunit ClpA
MYNGTYRGINGFTLVAVSFGSFLLSWFKLKGQENFANLLHMVYYTDNLRPGSERGAADGGIDVTPLVNIGDKMDQTHELLFKMLLDRPRDWFDNFNYKYPKHFISTNEMNKLKDLNSKLKRYILGQDKAIDEVVRSIKLSFTGFRPAEKPKASLLFVGPTGVGKTELSKLLAKYLYMPLLRFDMSEFQEKYTVSRLIGSVQGYVGYDDGGRLTNSVLKQPHAVVLLDEIEKAHPDIFNILLQIMDYATLTDNRDCKVDFRNVILIMTSNIGAGDIGKNLIGFGDRKIIGDEAMDIALEKVFSPEFRNRLDAVVHFSHLSREIIVSIIRKELDDFTALLAKKKITVIINVTCIEKLTEEWYSMEFGGARNAIRLVEKKIKSLFIDEVLFGRLANGGNAVVEWRDGDYCLDIIKKKFW